MPSLLAITASPRGASSISNALTDAFVKAWKQNHSSGSIVIRDLSQTELPYVDLPWIAGAYTPAEERTPEMVKGLDISDKLIAELQAADHIVIGTPMYNFAVPSALKAWIDQIVRFGVTFTASYEGLLKNKKVTVVVASGGVYTPGSHMEGYNFETAYLKHILGFVGLTDVSFVMAGGSNDVAIGNITQEELVSKFTPEVEAAAS